VKNGGGSKKTGFPAFFTGMKKIESGEKLTSEEFALFPLRELVLYPNTIVPIFISYQPGMAALEEALRRDNRMFAACIKKKDRSRQDSDILFICGGAFVGLDKIIARRVVQHPLGFGAEAAGGEKSLRELFESLHPDDLIHFGMIPEFIGRLPIAVSLEDLKREELKRIITEPHNAIVKQYQASLAYDNVQLEFTEGAIDAIADTAIKQKTGARGLRAIVEKLMTDIMFEIPSIKGGKQVIITQDVVERTEAPIIQLLQKSA